MRLSTGNLDNSFIHKRLKNLWREDFFRSTVASSAEDTRSTAEYVAFSGEVEQVVSSAANLLQMAHFFLILAPKVVLGHILLSL